MYELCIFFILTIIILSNNIYYCLSNDAQNPLYFQFLYFLKRWPLMTVCLCATYVKSCAHSQPFECYGLSWWILDDLSADLVLQLPRAAVKVAAVSATVAFRTGAATALRLSRWWWYHVRQSANFGLSIYFALSSVFYQCSRVYVCFLFVFVSHAKTRKCLFVYFSHLVWITIPFHLQRNP